jgi:hypothetical protein
VFRADKARHSLLRIEHMAEWQPMSAAPKSHPLLLSWDGKTRVGMWSQHHRCWVSLDAEFVNGRPYKEFPDGWQDFPEPIPNRTATAASAETDTIGGQ